MAIARDTSVDGGSSSGGALTFSWSHTCTGSNLILKVGALCGAGDDITGVTYNSVQMSKIGATQGEIATSFINLWHLEGPSTGSNTITITSSIGTTLSGVSSSYTGVAQSGQPDAHTDSTITTASSISETITVVASNSWAVMVATDSVDVAGRSATNLTIRIDSSSGLVLADSNGALGAGSFTGTITGTQSEDWGANLASFAPFGAAPPPPFVQSGGLFDVPVKARPLLVDISYSSSAGLSLSSATIIAPFQPTDTARPMKPVGLLYDGAFPLANNLPLAPNPLPIGVQYSVAAPAPSVYAAVMRTVSSYYVLDAAVHNPLAQLDWPLPSKTVYPVDLRSSIGFSQVGIQPNVPPPYAYDWPLPRGFTYPIDLRSEGLRVSLAILLPLTPFTGLDWPLPLRATYQATLRTATPPIPYGFQGPENFFGLTAPLYDWTPPRSREYPSQLRTSMQYSRGFLLDTTFGGPGQPLTPVDIQVPRRAPWLQYYDPVNRLPTGLPLAMLLRREYSIVGTRRFVPRALWAPEM